MAFIRPPKALLRQLITRSMSTTTNCKRLEKKVALVTASTDGIGLAVARRLLREGARVVVSSRKQTNVDRAVAELSADGQVKGIACHVAKREQRRALLDFTAKEFGQLDVLVSNAAVSPAMGQFLDTTEDEFDKIFEINVKSAFLLTQEALPLLEKSDQSPSIVYVSSIGAYQSFPLIAGYSVSKTALLGLSRAVALQCAPKIRANCVCPGVIKTRFSEPLWSNEGALDELKRVIPMHRPGETDEVASLVAFLVSDDASYVTGESFVVAGGHFSRL